MATTTAPIAWSPATGAARYRSRQLWQVPVFCAGVLALAGVCLLRVLGGGGPAGAVERDLATARRLLTQPDCPVDRLEATLERAMGETERAPLRAGEAHFLLGSAYLRLAGASNPAGAAGARQQARAHLEQADQFGVADADRPRLLYRLAKVWFLTGADPQRVVDSLARSVDAADDPVEGYALLAQAYLRLPQPDLQAALDANWKQLQLPTLNEEVLAPARLLRGELFLKVQKPEEARAILKFVRPPAPPELVLRASALQARSYQAEEQWARAAQLWQDVLAAPNVPAVDAGTFRYCLGLCHQHLGQLDAAAEDWEKARAAAPGEVAQAAETALAEARLHGSTPQVAMEHFRRLVHDVHGPGDWHNTLVDLPTVREVFERGCELYHKTGRHQLAMELAGLYAPLAEPGVAQALNARSAEAAARELLESAQRTQPASAARPLAESARGLFREAGRKYEAAVVAAATPAEQAERLAHSANCFVQGEECAAAIPVLQRWLKTGPPPERVGDVWFCLGEAYRNLHRDTDAGAAYRECLKQRGAAACRARYELALLEMARGEWDGAADDLDANLKVLSTEHDDEAQEKTLFALGNLHYRRQNYLIASLTLEKALGLYPNSGRATIGRYQLAECYRNLALQESQNMRSSERMRPETERHYEGQYRAWLEKAATGYTEVARSFADRLNAGPLPEEEESLYRLAGTAAADCRSDLGQDQAAVQLYEALAARYHHRVEGLAALAGMARCYWRKGQGDQARQTLERVRTALNEMDPSAFPSQPGGGTRAEWQEWLGKMVQR
jgi:tetratricopeptide (TPR) repeat protein